MMPDKQPDESPADAAPESIHRVRIAINIAVQLALLFIIVITANYLSCRHHRQWDLTHNRKFTLSSTTANFLESLSADVELIVAFSPSSPIYSDVKGLVEEYRRSGRNHIHVEHLDPVRNRTRAMDVLQKYNLQLDAEESRNAVIVSSGDNTRLVAEANMILLQEEGVGRLEAFRGEEALTSALISTVEQEKRKLYLIYGHRRIDQIERLKEDLDQLVTVQNAVIEKLSLPEIDAIPDDCSALILAGATADLNASEMKTLRKYWVDRKGSFLVLLDPGADTPNLAAFLREYGVAPRDDRVLTAAGIPGMSVRKSYAARAFFLPGSPITRDLIGIPTELPGQSQSLHVFKDDVLLKSQNIVAIPLAVADNRFWGETDYHAESVSRDELDDHLAPLYLAASVQRGAVDDPRLRVQSSRLVVVGNSELLEKSPRRIKSNYDFSMAAINWLLDREELIGITPRQPSRYSLALTPKQFTHVQTLVLFVMPAAVFLFGIGVWAARRS